MHEKNQHRRHRVFTYSLTARLHSIHVLIRTLVLAYSRLICRKCMCCHQSDKIKRDQDTCKSTKSTITTSSEQPFSVKLGKVYNTRLAILYGAKIMVTDLEMLNFISNDKTHLLHTFSSFCCASQDGARITKSSA